MCQKPGRPASGGAEGGGANPQARAVTAACKGFPCVWVLAWPSLLGGLGQFHHRPEPPSSCLCNGGGETYLAGGEGEK